MAEQVRELNRLHPTKAVGPDGVKYFAFQQCGVEGPCTVETFCLVTAPKVTCTSVPSSTETQVINSGVSQVSDETLTPPSPTSLNWDRMPLFTCYTEAIPTFGQA